MGMRRRIVVLGIAACALTLNGATLFDFENLGDGTVLAGQYPNILFSGGTIQTSGLSLNEFEFPPRSGANVVGVSGGPLTVDLFSPAFSFAAYFTYSAPVQVLAFDFANQQIGVATSAFLDNRSLSGVPGSSANERLSIAAAGISRVVISGSSFTLDDASVDFDSQIPEPGTGALVLTALFAFHRLRKARFEA